jgi:hypothetical protein
VLLKSNHRCVIEYIISLLRDYYNRRWESYRAVDVCVRGFWQNSNIKTLVLCIDRYTLRIVVCMLGADSLYHFLRWSVPGLLSCYVHNCLLYCVLGLKTLSFYARNNGVVWCCNWCVTSPVDALVVVIYLPWVWSVNLNRQCTGHLCDRCCTTIRRHGIACDSTRMCAIWCILDINYEIGRCDGYQPRYEHY